MLHVWMLSGSIYFVLTIVFNGSPMQIVYWFPLSHWTVCLIRKTKYSHSPFNFEWVEFLRSNFWFTNFVVNSLGKDDIIACVHLVFNLASIASHLNQMFHEPLECLFQPPNSLVLILDRALDSPVKPGIVAVVLWSFYFFPANSLCLKHVFTPNKMATIARIATIKDTSSFIYDPFSLKLLLIQYGT